MKTALAQLPPYQFCRAFSAFDFSATKKSRSLSATSIAPAKPELESFSWARRAVLSEQVET